MNERARFASAVLCLFAPLACGGTTTPSDAPSAPPPLPSASVTPPQPTAPVPLGRIEFNQLAVRLNLPLFWAEDKDADGEPDPNEVLRLAFYPTVGNWVYEGKFTSEFEAARSSILEARGRAEHGSTPEETRRRELVVQDLDQGMPTVLHSDLTGLSEAEKKFVDHVLTATTLIDEIYAIQNGAAALSDRVPKDHPPSQSLFRRNWGPECRGPKTESIPECSAIPGSPKPKVGVYPESMQDARREFCKKLEEHKDAKQLLAPFVVVKESGGKLEPVPYTSAFGDRMKRIAEELRAGARALEGIESEAALRAYLAAAAKSFETNDWEPADEAWAKMHARNSKWYLRIGPDETYWDPCNHKAGFHATFARINSESLTWQDKLTPLRQKMEADLAKLIGAPYKQRKVSFRLPDFIDIVSNGGDDRNAFGATIGQSLPNWGKVANEGRGRTVAMQNLYTDPDSRKNRRDQAASLLGKRSFELLSDDTTPQLLGTILHEATHNLGPSHEYKYKGKTDSLAFGGPLSQMLEELKAQSGALYFLDLVTKEGVIDEQTKRRAYVDAVVWAFGHISRGMYSENGQPKTYSQLAAIQIGFLMDEGVVRFDPALTAENGSDKGAFEIDVDKLAAAAEKLMQRVGKIKATNDRAGGEELVKRYVDGDVVPMKAISERMLRFPKSSFVYAIDR